MLRLSRYDKASNDLGRARIPADEDSPDRSAAATHARIHRNKTSDDASVLPGHTNDKAHVPPGPSVDGRGWRDRPAWFAVYSWCNQSPHFRSQHREAILFCSL